MLLFEEIYFDWNKLDCAVLSLSLGHTELTILVKGKKDIIFNNRKNFIERWGEIILWQYQ